MLPELKFSVFRIPVRVQLWFLVLSVLIGTWWNFHDPASILLFVAIVFVSVLTHELGHAFMGRAFGLKPAIALHGLGGLTSWTGGRAIGPGRSFLISLAGPAMGFFLGGLLLLAGFAISVLAPSYHMPEQAHALAMAALSVNIVWSIFNLLPILPLDGGNALRSFWALTKIGDAEVVARIVSMIVGVAIAALAGITNPRGNLFIVVILVMYVGQNYTGLRVRFATRGDELYLRQLRDAYPVWLGAQDGAAMIRAGTQARVSAKTPQLVAYATEIIAMGQCLEGDARSGLATLGALPRGFAPSLEVALRVLDAAGEHAAALELLRRAAESSGDPELQRRFEDARERARIAGLVR